ncbi:hypothetical protein BURPS305_0108 [Burkholderia pseudomallei 305]|nr:hypothetical protein BURPS305_0108 [Burkholderia pseudomallei 305]
MDGAHWLVVNMGKAACGPARRASGPQAAPSVSEMAGRA